MEPTWERIDLCKTWILLHLSTPQEIAGKWTCNLSKAGKALLLGSGFVHLIQGLEVPGSQARRQLAHINPLDLSTQHFGKLARGKDWFGFTQVKHVQWLRF